MFDEPKVNHGLLDVMRSKGALKSLHPLLNFNFQLILFRLLNDIGTIACSNADVLCPRLETPKGEHCLAIRLAMAKGGKTDS